MAAIQGLDKIEQANIKVGAGNESKFGTVQDIKYHDRPMLVLLKNRKICFEFESKLMDKHDRPRYTLAIECTKDEYEKYKVIEMGLVGKQEGSRMKPPSEFQPFIVADITYADDGNLDVELRDLETKKDIEPTEKKAKVALAKKMSGNFLIQFVSIFEDKEKTKKSIKIKLLQAATKRAPQQKVVSTFMCE